MEGYNRYFRSFKQWKIFAIVSIIIIFCMTFIPARAEETEIPDSYEKTVIKTYSLSDGDIPIGIEYSEYNKEMGQEYAGTLYMTEGDMQKGFHFRAVYKGTLNRVDSTTYDVPEMGSFLQRTVQKSEN